MNFAIQPIDSALSVYPYTIPRKISSFLPNEQTILPKALLFPAPVANRKIINEQLFDFLSKINEIRTNLIRYEYNPGESKNDARSYDEYLQFPNRKVREYALSIVGPSDSNDEKAYKITNWVIENIEYRSDFENYGQAEYWAYPALTLAKESGDCEDGAFLIHSLMLNAGVPPDRIRTYGGLVIAGQRASTGGHAWTSYKRETDKQWVVLDWSYLPQKDAIEERIPMPEDQHYLDDYFYLSFLKFVETPFANLVRHPEKGLLVDGYA